MAKELIVHVGHSKTGSSYIQAALENNVNSLERLGVTYPSCNKGSGIWEISSGNGYIILGNQQYTDSKANDKLIISAEQLFSLLIRDDMAYNKLKNFAEKNGFAKVSLILFIRDPIDHAESEYQQVVKRGGGTLSASEFFLRYSQPRMVEDFIRKFDSKPGFDLKIFNYSNHKKDIFRCLMKCVGINCSDLVQRDDVVVNRSMTAPEIKLQIEVNHSLGRRGRLLSDELCNRLPMIKSDKMYPAKEIQEDLIKRMNKSISFVNSYVEESERYGLSLRGECVETEDFNFNQAQIKVIGRVLGEEIARLSEDAIVSRAELSLVQAKFARSSILYSKWMKRFDDVTSKLSVESSSSLKLQRLKAQVELKYNHKSGSDIEIEKRLGPISTGSGGGVESISMETEGVSEMSSEHDSKVVESVAKALFQEDFLPSSEGMERDEMRAERKAHWNQNAREYIKRARIIVRRLERSGVDLKIKENVD